MRIKAFITNLGKYNEGELVGEWITFPITEDELEKVHERIGINFDEPINGTWYEETFFTDYDCDFAHNFGEYSSVEELNEIAEKLEAWDEAKFYAACEVWLVSEVLQHDADDYILFTDVNSNTSLGEYYAEETGVISEIPEHLQGYFDYELYGRDLNYTTNGGFSSFGYIMCNRY